VVENKGKEFLWKISKSGNNGGEYEKGGEPGLCEQFTDTDSIIFTICQYILWGTTLETGTRKGGGM
jgi:hypothetical protein